MEIMEINKNFWKNKKVFLTGHTGFKGAWLTLWLKMLGADVMGFALPPNTVPSMYSQVESEINIDSVYGDIRDLDLLRNKIAQFRPDIVIHLAAQAIVRYSYQNTIETFQTNVIGTANVLEAVRHLDTTRAVLCITSDKCYENREWVWKYRENDPMGGWDPYSASKGCSELVISSYRNSFFNNDQYQNHGVALASARAGNVIGGGDWGENRLIPDIMRAFSVRENVGIRNPDAIRPWQHVLDLSMGYLLLTERLYEKGPEYAEAWNFGPGDAGDLTVLEIVDYISKMWGEGVTYTITPDNNLHEAYLLKLDSSKARSRLGWKTQLTMNESLDKIIQWYKAFYYHRDNVNELTKNQILEYEHLHLVPNNKLS
jgi:CDP-glucose 4,6-dehydratase